MSKPCRLELNNSGAWKLLGRFDAADEEHSSLVMDAAEDLIKTLHNCEDSRRCPTLRISIDHHADSVDVVLLRWTIERGWYDAKTGDAA